MHENLEITTAVAVVCKKSRVQFVKVNNLKSEQI